MISQVEFENMIMKERAELLWEDGIFLIQKKYYNHTINLYQLYNFYVEAWYQNDNNELIDISVMWSLDRLNLYLTEIDISDGLAA